MGANSNKDDDGAQADAGRNSDSPGRSPFAEGEKVLVDHGSQIYEAKVQKSELRKKEWKYLVHYLGWSKSWDEWLTTDRLMKHNDEGVKKMQSFNKSQNLEKNAKGGRATQNKPKTSNDNKVDKEDMRQYGGRGKKRKHDSSVVEKDTEFAEKLVKIQFPTVLRKQLVDDWEFVTQLGKLVKLPRSPNVDDILKGYLEYRVKKDNTIAEGVGEILKGLREYFDKALPAMLLYKKERQQYQESMKDNVSPSTVYGAEHLLRLFVKLPELLAYVNMEEEALMRLQQKLLDFLKYLQKNQHTFFLSTYDGSKSLKETDEEQSN